MKKSLMVVNTILKPQEKLHLIAMNCLVPTFTISAKHFSKSIRKNFSCMVMVVLRVSMLNLALTVALVEKLLFHCH